MRKQCSEIGVQLKLGLGDMLPLRSFYREFIDVEMLKNARSEKITTFIVTFFNSPEEIFFNLACTCVCCVGFVSNIFRSSLQTEESGKKVPVQVVKKHQSGVQLEIYFRFDMFV